MISQAARYIYPGLVLPVVPYCASEGLDPSLVPHQLGAIGFDFVKIFQFEIEPGHSFEHVLSYVENHYWGEEISIDDLTNSPDFASIEYLADTDRFVMTSWGALIPLFEDDIVVPYPTFIELPLDMRLD